MAVTSLRFVRRASRKASQVYTKSPRSTPNAVPGIIRFSTNSAEKCCSGAEDALSNVVKISITVRLSSINPKKALTSPQAAHAYRFIEIPRRLLSYEKSFVGFRLKVSYEHDHNR